MSDYTPSGAPFDNTRYTAKQLRAEYALLQTAINSKTDKLAREATSTTSLSIGLGQKVLTVEEGKDFGAGEYVRIADNASPGNNYMNGTVDSYDDDTGELIVTVTNISGSGTKTAWTVTITSPSGVTLESNTFKGHQNFAKATVASHATTSDIWNALGNMIDFTGTATVTSLPAAPQAGASRELICSGACSFTASASLLIDGYASGETVTCAANDIVLVRAITTTLFRLTRIRHDGLPQELDIAGNHVVTLSAGNGVGTDTGNLILRFTTITEQIGTAIELTASATAGYSMTIKENGMYAIFLQVLYNNTGYGNVGVSVNSNQLTTSISTINSAHRIFFMQIGGASTNAGASIGARIVRLSANDVIRGHLGGAGLNNQALNVFSVRKIASV